MGCVAVENVGTLQDVRKQLLAIMDRYKLDLASAGRDYSRICKAIASGYFFHAARKDAQEGYKTIVRPLAAALWPCAATNACFKWLLFPAHDSGLRKLCR